MISPQELILEACLETPEEAHSAFLNGAHRVELCRNLESGGLSPSRETVRRYLEICELPLKVLVRPRPGNFVYSEKELTSMETEIDLLNKLPITGIVLGVLQDDRSINLEAVQRLSERADPLTVTFHKAIDETRDPLQEMKKLSRIQNIQSILSSGGAQNAETEAKMLKTMQQEFQSRFRMIAAGSITSENLLSLHHKIGFPEYHGRKIVGDLARSSLQKQGSGRTDQLGLKISI